MQPITFNKKINASTIVQWPAHIHVYELDTSKVCIYKLSYKYNAIIGNNHDINKHKKR